MKTQTKLTLICAICTFILFNSCEYSNPPASPGTVVKEYHLVSSFSGFPGTQYAPNEVVLLFDTANLKLTIAGSLDSVFFTKGTYDYEIRDTTYPEYNWV